MDNVSICTPITNWALRFKEQFKVFSGDSGSPLVVELVGMSGVGKTTLMAELGKYFYNTHGIQTVKYDEPDFLVNNVSSQNRKAFLQVKFDNTCERLNEALAGKAGLVIFDRGLFDFILWANAHLNQKQDKGIEEKDCKDYLREIFEKGDGKIDVLFVYTTSVVESVKSKPLAGTSLMASLDLTKENPEEKYARFQYYKKIYDEFFLKNLKVFDAVKCVRNIHLDKLNKEYQESLFPETVILIDLYLVFKAWENWFLLFHKEKLENGALKSEVIKLAKSLEAPLAYLRNIVQKTTQCDKKIIEILRSYKEKEFVIARYKGKKITIKGIFDSPPKFQVV